MAVKKDVPADIRGLAALRRDLSSNGARPAYLLTGDDRRDVDRAVEAIQAASVPPELEGFNATRLRGIEDGSEDVVAACGILPMLGDRRFVLVREPERLTGDLLRLVAYCKSPSPSTTLVLVPAQLDRRLGWVKPLEAACFKVDFAPPVGRELEAWIRDELRERGASIDPPALAMLLDLTAAETILLSNELEKLALACEGGRITVEDVAAVVGRTRSTEIWALTNAIEDGDRVAALSALRRLFDQGAAAPMIVAMIDWCFGRLFATEAPRAFPGRQQVLDRRRDELRGEGGRLYGMLREADRLVRTTGGKPEAVLERLVLEMPASRRRS